MPSYTQRLKDIFIRSGRSYDAIGLDRYPIHNEAHRVELNDKILSHYWNEEIGHESESMFVQAMRSRMSIVMPYYNELYKSNESDYDPLIDVDMATDTENVGSMLGTSEQTTDASGTSSTNATAKSTATGEGLNYTYPQQQIQSAGQYATSGSDSKSGSDSQNTSEDSQQSNSTTTGKNDSETRANGKMIQRGRSRSAQSLIAEFRQNILNIDQLIIVELEDLFMATWTTGNALTHGSASLYNWNYPYGY